MKDETVDSDSKFIFLVSFSVSECFRHVMQMAWFPISSSADISVRPPLTARTDVRDAADQQFLLISLHSTPLEPAPQSQKNLEIIKHDAGQTFLPHARKKKVSFKLHQILSIKA